MECGGDGVNATANDSKHHFMANKKGGNAGDKAKGHDVRIAHNSHMRKREISIRSSAHGNSRASSLFSTSISSYQRDRTVHTVAGDRAPEELLEDSHGRPQGNLLI